MNTNDKCMICTLTIQSFKNLMIWQQQFLKQKIIFQIILSFKKQSQSKKKRRRKTKFKKKKNPNQLIHQKKKRRKLL